MLCLTKGLLFYVNLSASTPASAPGLPGSAWGSADTRQWEPVWLGAGRDTDLAAVLAGYAARLVHPGFRKSILLPCLCRHGAAI